MSVILAKVLQDYTPSDDKGLPLRKGQVIVIKDQSNSGWWRGLYKKDDGTFAKGLFPPSHVSILDEEEMKKRKIKVVKSSSGGDIPAAEAKRLPSTSPRSSSVPPVAHLTEGQAPPASSSSSSSKKKSSHAKLFGTPLANLVDASHPIPVIISHGIDFLSSQALQVPNLFRGPTPDKKKIQELKETYEKELTTGVTPDLSTWDLAVVASTFKLFLFYLPEPLLAPGNGYNDLTEAAKLEDQVEIVSRVAHIVDKFPENNKKLIKALFNFFTHSNENKLTRPILASVFGPILLPPRVNEDNTLVAKMHGKSAISPRGLPSSTQSVTTTSTTSAPAPPSTPANPTTPSNPAERRKRREESHANSPISPAGPSHVLSPPSSSHPGHSPTPSSSSASVASLQSELRAKDTRIRDAESTISSLRESAKDQEKRMKEMERMIANLKDQVKDKDREVSQFEAKHKKEKDKEGDQAKEQMRSRDNRIAALEQEVQKEKSARIQAQKETTEAREHATKLQAQLKTAEGEIAKSRTESQESNKARIVSLEKAMTDFQKEHSVLQQSYKEEQALRKKYWNLMEDMKGKIRVYCRTRPPLKGEGTAVIEAPDPYSCLLRHPRSGEHSFLFDCVYGPEATQETVFDDVKNMVQSAIDGYNVCIFAYGQTGSGKTHTMVGDTKLPGIVPRALSHLFDLLAKLTKTTHGYVATVSCYMLELYNEQLLDMLADEKDKPEIKIKKDPNGVVYAHNAHIVRLHNSMEAERLLQRGFSARRTETTNMNEHSSRSHLVQIITLLVESKDPGTHATTHGKISFIDLAGSERVSKSGVANERLKEAQAINLSLSALGDVIAALSRGESFVPYRNHKLTLLMSDSLGGNSKTLMITCVSPSPNNVEESLSSLGFATRAKQITNNPVKTVESLEVARLKKIIQDLRSGGKSGLPEELAVITAADDTKDKDAEIQRLKALVVELRAAVTPRGRTPRGEEPLVSPGRQPKPVPDPSAFEPSKPNGVHHTPSFAVTPSPTPPTAARTTPPSLSIPTSSGAPSPVSLPYTPVSPTASQLPSRPAPLAPNGTTPSTTPSRPSPSKPTPTPASAPTPPSTPPQTPSPILSTKPGPASKVPVLSLGDVSSKSSSTTAPTDNKKLPTKSPREGKSPRHGKSPRDATGKSPREKKTPRDKATPTIIPTSLSGNNLAVPQPVTPGSVPPTPTITPPSPTAALLQSPTNGKPPVLQSPDGKSGARPNIASIAAAAAAAAATKRGAASPRVETDRSSPKGDVGVVLPSKPGEKLTHPKRPTMPGRKKPTKNAIQNKRDMEQKSMEVKAAAGTSGATNSKMPRVSQSVGGFNLLAHLVVNKADNGGSPRTTAKLTPAPSFSSLAESSSELNLSGSITGSLQLGSSGGLPSNVEFKQLLDPGGPKLLQIKGRRKVKVRLIELSCRSLNQGDVFILDVGSKLFLWNGSRSNRMEKAKGLDVCTRIKDKDRNTRATIITLDENDNNPEFWDPLGGRGPIAEESEGGDDATTDITEDDLLYKIEEQEGKYVANLIERKRPAKEMLESSSCYVVDSHSEMYVWIGRACTTGSKAAIGTIAKDLFFDRKDRPTWTRISKLNEGAETVLFKEKFSNWPDKLPIATSASVVKGRVASINKDDKVDIQKMFEYKPPVPRVVDGTDPRLQIWIMSDFEKKEIPQDQYGQFYSAESYIIMYTYMVKFKECYQIFFWQGRNSSINEKGTSALLTVDLDEKSGGTAEQIRVVQNQEPLHFLKLFEGKMIVHKGKYTSAATQQTALYHVRNTHAVQVVARTTSLNSNDSFLLRTPTHLYVWHGKGVTAATRKSAQQIAQHPFMKAGGRKFAELVEEAEQGGFWTSFGTEGDPTQYVKHVWEPNHPPRLFHCTNSSGRFTPREVFNACQDDLVQDDVMILDLYKCVYLWEGKGANEEEKRLGMELAVEYARNAPDKRPADAPVYLVKSGREPRLFVSGFHGWDSTNTILDINESTHIPLVEDMLRQYSRSYTLDELLGKPKELDQTNLEYYLTDQDFLKHFTMSKEEYRVLPVWKREIQKKKVGLY